MNLPEKNNRRDFLKLSALAGLGLGLQAIPSAEAGPDPKNLKFLDAHDIGITRPRPAGNKPVWDLQTKPLNKVRCAFIGLNRGSTHLTSAVNLDFAEVIAVCDLVESRAKNAVNFVKKHTGKEPAMYAGTEDAWEKMVARDDIDVVYIATPWEWHVPMAVKTMESGKHAFVEVSAAVSVEEAWRLVDTSEKTQRHCAILENCCYGDEELFVLNMARSGLFGDLKHAECAYIHDLGGGVLWDRNGEGGWRRNYHTFMDGNLYPTHGLGPVGQYLGVGRGDAFKFIVSVSSPEFNLTQFRDKKQPNGGLHRDEKYVCGDMNTSIIKTQLGRTIMIQHDVVSPRPYSRINALCGTKATFFGYPSRLAVASENEHPAVKGLKLSSHSWLEKEKIEEFMKNNQHPLVKKVGESAKKVGGHGGMDHVMNYRMLDCIRQGITPDMTVYDAANWSAILELSVRSVKEGSMPIVCPDFTRGGWNSLKPLDIVS
jgi:Oxidoreductase family, NAD-binding Rossmann fold